MAEHVILFAGPMGAGKTTAIRTLSDIEVVATEAENTERELVDKPTTTVALDYGEILLGEDEKVRLYGIPGQRRFDFMWSILKERARGMILLVNTDAPDPVASLLEFLGEFRDLYDKGGVVVGISRYDLAVGPSLTEYSDAVAAEFPEFIVPIFTLDPRDAAQMRMALMTLIASIEARAFVNGTAAA